MRNRNRDRKMFTKGDRVVFFSNGGKIVGKVIDDSAHERKYVVLSEDGQRFEKWDRQLDRDRRTAWDVLNSHDDEWSDVRWP